MAARYYHIRPGLISRAFFSFFLLSAVACSEFLQAQDQVVVLTPHPESIRYEFGRAFPLWYEGREHRKVVVDWRDSGGTSDALKFVQSEFARKPDGIGIDVFFGGGPEPFILLSEAKLTLPYELPPETMNGLVRTINGIEIYDSKFAWYGAVLSSFGILQNTQVQRLAGLPMVSRWNELSNPKLFGWVGAGDPRNSGTMNNMYEAFFQAKGWQAGWELLTCVAGNVGKFDRISSTTAKEVTLGESSCAFAIDFYAFSQIAAAGRSNMTFALPQDFMSVSPDGICVLHGTKNETAAKRFLEFVMSEDGQRLWILPKGHPQGPQMFSIERMSVRPDFYSRYKGISNIEFSPFDMKQDFRYDAKLARKRREIVAGMVGALLVDAHPELVKAWRAIIDRGSRPEEISEFGKPPLTEQEAIALAQKDWQNPVIRNRKRIEWQLWAREKYRKLEHREAHTAKN